MTTQLQPSDLDHGIAEMVREAATAAGDRQAGELRILALHEVTSFTDYFVICSGKNAKQVQAIADGIDDRLRRQDSRPLHVEGHTGGQWVLLDYGDFVVHVFDEDRREFYGLERLWSDAPDVTEELTAS